MEFATRCSKKDKRTKLLAAGMKHQKKLKKKKTEQGYPDLCMLCKRNKVLPIKFSALKSKAATWSCEGSFQSAARKGRNYTNKPKRPKK